MSLPPVWKIKRELRRIAKQAAIAHAHLHEIYLRRQQDRKSTRLNSSHVSQSRMPSSA